MKTIFVVDDDAITLKMAQFTLSQNPSYEIVLVDSGSEAYRILSEKKADLVLLDIEMPGLSGIKTLEMIRANEDFVSVPVIFLTAVSDTQSIIDAASLGALGYIKKPFLPEDLLAKVKNVLGE